MKYADFEQIISAPRLGRYVRACGNNTRKAMTLYRLNLRLSQELYTVVSCFEIALRNAVDAHYTARLGNDWLRNAVASGGIFDTNRCRKTADVIRTGIRRLGPLYTHHKLVAEMDFGLWRYLFAQPQYYAAHQTLLQIFPAKPSSTPLIQYNQTLIFNELAQVNDVRNRMAHHEPICFQVGGTAIDSTYVRQQYGLIKTLFQWMGVDEDDLLYGLDHIEKVCDDLDGF